MQIEMKFRATISIRASGKRGKNASGVNVSNANSSSASAMNGNIQHVCSDCRVELVKQQMEFVCPKCGMVEELIDGSE